MTKGRNLPQTPVSAMPQTPVPQTPNVTSTAQGWMEDIKRVISFDSVEEFWGYVNRPCACFLLKPSISDCIIILFRHPNCLRRQITICSRSVCVHYNLLAGSHKLSHRKVSSRLGRMKPIKMGVNGVYNCPRIKTVLMLIGCGSIRYIQQPT
jgi:hypothetical protein